MQITRVPMWRTTPWIYNTLLADVGVMPVKWSHLSSCLLVVVGMATVSPAAVIFSSGDSLDGFSVADNFVPRDYGVKIDAGAEADNPHTTDNAIFFTTRADNSHTLSWRPSVVVSSTDTLKIDVRNVIALGPATLTVRIYYSGQSRPHEGLVSHKLTDDNYQQVVVSMPPGKGKHRIQRVDFFVNENNKVIYLDNLTLTFEDNSVAESGR